MLDHEARHFRSSFKELGQALAILAVVFHGSSGLYAKCTDGGPVARGGAKVMTHPFLATSAHPVEVALFFSLGIFMSSFFPSTFLLPQSGWLSMWGVLAGVLCVAHHAFSVVASWLIGLPTVAAISSCAAILSAFTAGWALLDDEVWSSSMVSVAMSLMLLGTVGVCWCNEIARYLRYAEERSPLLYPFRLESRWRKASSVSKAAGILMAIASGLSGASVLVPWRLQEVQEGTGHITGFFESFGLTVLLVGASPCVVYLLYFSGRSSLMTSESMVRCPCLAGVIWNLGNLSAMFAMRHLGYAATYAIFHCQMAVVVFWNLTLFGEVTTRAWPIYMGAVVFLASGATILLLDVHS